MDRLQLLDQLRIIRKGYLDFALYDDEHCSSLLVLLVHVIATHQPSRLEIVAVLHHDVERHALEEVRSEKIDAFLHLAQIDVTKQMFIEVGR
jgi:hypothetical protein